MLLAMTALVPLWFDQLFLGGMGTLAIILILYLSWLIFQEKRQRRKDEEERRRQRVAHWGNE